MARVGRSFPESTRLRRKIGRYTTAKRTFPWPIRVALQSRAPRLHLARVTHPALRRPTRPPPPAPAVFPHPLRVQAPMRVRPRPVHSAQRRQVGLYRTAVRTFPWPIRVALQARALRLRLARVTRADLRPKVGRYTITFRLWP